MSVFLPNTWAGQQYQYLKHGGDNPIANKKNDAGAGWHKLGACASARVCVLQHHSPIHHISPETMHLYVYIKRKYYSYF